MFPALCPSTHIPENQPNKGTKPPCHKHKVKESDTAQFLEHIEIVLDIFDGVQLPLSRFFCCVQHFNQRIGDHYVIIVLVKLLEKAFVVGHGVSK